LRMSALESLNNLLSHVSNGNCEGKKACFTCIYMHATINSQKISEACLIKVALTVTYVVNTSM